MVSQVNTTVVSRAGLSWSVLFVLSFLFTGFIVKVVSYQKADRTNANPILDKDSNIHVYVGNNLEPVADLRNENMVHVYLTNARLSLLLIRSSQYAKSVSKFGDSRSPIKQT